MALDWFTSLYQCFKGFIACNANAKEPVQKNKTKTKQQKDQYLHYDLLQANFYNTSYC